MDEQDWGKAQGETCSRCGKEKLMIFDHPLGRVCKKCYIWLQDNYIADGEKVKAKLLDDGRIILFREQG
jgi:hypothetical protein